MSQAPAQGPPSPPPTTPDASTSEPCQICQLPPEKPCDVDKIMLDVTGYKVGNPDPVNRKLEITTAHRRRERVDLRDVEVRRMLRREYDILIDIIADADADTFPDGLPAKIKGRAYYHGRSCAVQKHAELQLKPLGIAPELAPKTEIFMSQPGASVLDMPETELFAKTVFIDRKPDHSADNPFDAVTSVFGMITMLWQIKDYRMVELVARSCGRRAMEDTKAANLNLRSGVRIFRRSKLTAGIAIPALGTFNKTKTRDYIGDVTKTDTSASAGGNFYNSETRQQTHDDGRVSVVGDRQMGGTLSQHVYEGVMADGQTTTTGFSEMTRAAGVTSSSEMGSITREDVRQRLSRASGFEVVLTHNGTEVKILDSVKKLIELIENIAKVITDFKEILNSAPQLGWSFTFDVSAFAGSILLEWFPEYAPGVQANGRYLAVSWKLQGTIQIEIFKISVSASFGIDARAAGTGIVLKIEGTIDGKASVSAELNLDLFTPRQQIGVATEANATLRIVGHASIFGKTLADAELKGTGGIELVNGTLDVQWDKRTCDLKGRIESKPVMVTGYVRGWIFKSEIDPIEVMERKRLYDFQ